MQQHLKALWAWFVPVWGGFVAVLPSLVTYKEWAQAILLTLSIVLALHQVWDKFFKRADTEKTRN